MQTGELQTEGEMEAREAQWEPFATEGLEESDHRRITWGQQKWLGPV